jgi:hypothetical protein
MRKSIALLPPASNPMQMVWMVMIVGNAQMHSPRIHSLNALLSIQAKTGSIGCQANYAGDGAQAHNRRLETRCCSPLS